MRMRERKRIAMFIDWVRSLFEPKKYPWFRDEFIHPNELCAAPAPARAVRGGKRYVVASPSKATGTLQ